MSYFLTRDGQQYGPYEVDALRQMLAAGQITPADLIWMQGMPGWTPVSQVLSAIVPIAPAPPVYAAPAAYVQPPVGAGFARVAGAAPTPPNLHWAAVMILAGMTLGLFAIIWAFVEASFIKKVSPHRNGRGLLFSILLINVAFLCLAFLGWYDYHNSQYGGHWNRLFSMDPETMLPVLATPVIFVLWILGIVAIFRMRRGLLNHYNSVEPIQLRLGVFMTLFFNIYYFQHHMSRIAKWKQTGQLAPQ